MSRAERSTVEVPAEGLSLAVHRDSSHCPSAFFLFAIAVHAAMEESRKGEGQRDESRWTAREKLLAGTSIRALLCLSQMNQTKNN